MQSLSKNLHPIIKKILEGTPRSSDYFNSLDNGDGYLFKFDDFTDGTYFECIRSIDWGNATGENDGMYLIEQGNLIMPPNEEIEQHKESLDSIHDIVYMIIGYSGVESHYGGGDEIWIESSLSDVDEEERELYAIIPSNISIDDYIINKYT